MIGGDLIEHLLQEDGWDVVGVSRRGGADKPRLRHLAVDLLDRQSAIDALADLTEVTHVFYAAYQDRPTWAELVPPNVAMLVNVLDGIEPVARRLEHVSLMQGYKVYGAHLGPFSTPAREDDPPHMPPEFNVDQQSFLEARQAAQSSETSWTWSAMRPSVVCGISLGNPMNLAMVIAVYASISKELGIPLRFPGAPGAYDSLIEMTDAGLLAKATTWAATNPSTTNQAFNITNGDMFRWRSMWPRIAAFFDLETAPPLPMSLSDVMADKGDVWDQMVAKHGLEPMPYGDVSSWTFGDFVFAWNYDVLADGSRARRAGFHEYVETETMFLQIFNDLRERRLLP